MVFLLFCGILGALSMGLTDDNTETYYISHCSSLRMEDNHNDPRGNYILTQSIDCTGIYITPNFSAENFYGVFNGKGFTISNLTITLPENETYPVGLFSYLGQDLSNPRSPQIGTIQDVNFQNLKIKSDYEAKSVVIGSLVGTSKGGKISNVTITNLEIDPDGGTNNTIIGGVIGLGEDTVLSKVHIRGAVIKKSKMVGGLLGTLGTSGNANLDSPTIALSSVQDLKAQTSGGTACNNECAFGGLIGSVETGGGGEVNHPKISRSFVDFRINSQGEELGAIESVQRAGGLIGMVRKEANITIEDSYSNIRVWASDKYAGGIIGQVENAECKDGCGGIITLSRVYVAGLVEGGGSDGGAIIGWGNESNDKGTDRVKVNGDWDVYFDKETTRRQHSGILEKAEGKLTGEMKSASTYPNDVWKRSIWTFNTGYPDLIGNSKF